MSLTTEDWRGEFGDSYTERQRRGIDTRGRGPFWNGLVEKHGITSALEVGCSTGMNMVDLEIPIVGVDVNQLALKLVPNRISTYSWPATDLLFKDRSFDLVFTFGVLIHIPPEDLPKAMSEIVRCAKRYVFAGEYFGADEVPYRGGVLWRRDYGALYEEMGLETVEMGALEGPPWDRNEVTWWLLKKED